MRQIIVRLHRGLNLTAEDDSVPISTGESWCPARAHRPPGVPLVEVSEMLATLAIYLSILLILCTLSLVICWAYDNVGRPVKAEGSGMAESELAVPPRRRRSPIGLPSPRLAGTGWRSRPPRPRLQSRQARPGRRPQLSEGTGSSGRRSRKGHCGHPFGLRKSARSIVKLGPRSGIGSGRMFGVATRRTRHQYAWGATRNPLGHEPHVSSNRPNPGIREKG